MEFFAQVRIIMGDPTSARITSQANQEMPKHAVISGRVHRIPVTETVASDRQGKIKVYIIPQADQQRITRESSRKRDVRDSYHHI